MPVVTRLDNTGNLKTTTEFDEISISNVRFDGSGVVFAREFCEVWTGINTVASPVMQPYNIFNDNFAETPQPYSQSLRNNFVYTPYNLLLGDFLGDFTTNDYNPPSNTPLMRHMMTADVIVYNEIDEVGGI